MNCGAPTKRLRRAQLLKVATRVLRSASAAEAWLSTPQRACDHAVPLDLTDTLEGFQRVVDELEALE